MFYNLPVPQGVAFQRQCDGVASNKVWYRMVSRGIAWYRMVSRGIAYRICYAPSKATSKKPETRAKVPRSATRSRMCDASATGANHHRRLKACDLGHRLQVCDLFVAAVKANDRWRRGDMTNLCYLVKYLRFLC